MQEAYCPPHSKCSAVLSQAGTHLRMGVPHLWTGGGCTPSLDWNTSHPDQAGVPPCPDPGWGAAPIMIWLGYPPLPTGVDRLKTLPSPSFGCGGNKENRNILIQNKYFHLINRIIIDRTQIKCEDLSLTLTGNSTVYSSTNSAAFSTEPSGIKLWPFICEIDFVWCCCLGKRFGRWPLEKA